MDCPSDRNRAVFDRRKVPSFHPASTTEDAFDSLEHQPSHIRGERRGIATWPPTPCNRNSLCSKIKCLIRARQVFAEPIR